MITQLAQPVLEPLSVALAKRLPTFVLVVLVVALGQLVAQEPPDPVLYGLMLVGFAVGTVLQLRRAGRQRVPDDARGPAVLVVRHPQDLTGRLTVTAGDRVVRLGTRDCWALLPLPEGQHVLRVKGLLTLRSQPTLVDVAEGPALLVGVRANGRMGADGLDLLTEQVPAAPSWWVPFRQALPQVPFGVAAIVLLAVLL